MMANNSRLFDHNPENETRDLCKKGFAAYLRREINLAIHFYEEALMKDPFSTVANLALGTCYADLNEPMKAIRYFRETLQINPDDLEANYNLGTIYSKIGRHEKALGFLRNAL